CIAPPRRSIADSMILVFTRISGGAGLFTASNVWDRYPVTGCRRISTEAIFLTCADPSVSMWIQVISSLSERSTGGTRLCRSSELRFSRGENASCTYSRGGTGVLRVHTARDRCLDRIGAGLRG